MTASTLVGLQSMPGLVILYASIVKKKWAVNSAFMALYAFAAVLICWVLLCYRMAFGDQLFPFWGKGAPALGQKYLIRQAVVPEIFTFAAITIILLAGSVLGRMNIRAWMAFVPIKADRKGFPLQKYIAMLAERGRYILRMGWSGLNGRAPYAANIAASVVRT
ncbi:ammonium transporter 2 [Tanacetum coccineum]